MPYIDNGRVETALYTVPSGLAPPWRDLGHCSVSAGEMGVQGAQNLLRGDRLCGHADGEGP